MLVGGCECMCDVRKDYSCPDSKVGRESDVYKSYNNITYIRCNTVSTPYSTMGIWELKPVNPDRLIVLNKLMDMDKNSQRHPYHGTACDFHCVEA